MVIVEGKIKGKDRPRVFNGHAITTPETIKYENWVRVCFQNQCGAYLEGPIRARIIAYYKVPQSYSKKKLQSIRDGLEYPCKAPDIDNCIKIILDSLNNIAYHDDKQIVEVTGIKRWTEGVERIEFELEEIKEGV